MEEQQEYYLTDFVQDVIIYYMDVDRTHIMDTNAFTKISVFQIYRKENKFGVNLWKTTK